MKRNITVTLEKAKEWYNSNNETLKDIALSAFSEKELNAFDYTKVKTFNDALLCLYPFRSKEYFDVINNLKNISIVSKSSAAMFKLNIVKKVLNTGYNLHLTENAESQNYTWCPYFRFVTKNSTYYDDELKIGEYKKLGEITSEGVSYDVLSGNITYGFTHGLGHFYYSNGVGFADAAVGFLGCATKEIANHFSYYFGMLIMEAMYGDMIDFQIKKIY